VYTSIIEGVLFSDGLIHWFDPGTLGSNGDGTTDSINFALSGAFFFSGTLTYDVATDVDPLQDFYIGEVTLIANGRSDETGFATAIDNCTLFPVIGFTDEIVVAGTGCVGSPIVIERTWTATDDCGNSSSCVQTITVEDTDPPLFLSVPDDVVVDAEAGGCDAVVDVPLATATDNCPPHTATVTASRSDGKALGEPYASEDSPVVITWTAADACGNETVAVETTTVTVEPFTEAAIDIELVGSVAATRCVRIVLLDCDSGDSSDPLDVFVDVDGSGLGTAELALPCGSWTHVCVKDEKHTKWGTAPLLVDGLTFVSDGAVVCLPGDNDNDSDVDINDVTLLLAQFGGPEPGDNGVCPWDGIRGADYSNNGNVGATDYSLLSANWLTSSSCGCPTAEAPDDLPTSVPATAFAPAIAARADLDGNGVIDFRDVRIFERRNGLVPLLSEQIRLSEVNR
jgi:hypothetical protein